MKQKISFYLPFLIAGINFFISVSAEAQGPANSPLKIISPSPTAASLGNFGKIPVSYYTGTANVDVPLYTVKTNHHELNLSLQYASSGLKPAEDAGWAGLGWTLNAGGVITRVVCSNPDLDNGIKGYYYQDALPPNNSGNYYDASSPTSSSDMTKFNNMIQGATDGDPDIFYYSFPGYSGKFVMGKAPYPSPGEGIKYEASRTNLDIHYEDSGVSTCGWVITDGRGYKYFFYARENTDSYSNSSHIGITNQQAFEDNMSIDPVNTSPITSWYLTKIEAPSGEVITFEYTLQGASTTKSPVAYYEENNTMLAWNSMATNCNSTLQGVYYNYQVGRDVHFPLYLSRINFKTGYILINADETDKYRTDVVYTGTAPQKFKKLEVYDNNGKLIKKFVMDYSYFGTSSNTLNARLRLDKVTEYASDGLTFKPSYQFVYYNSSSTFPDKNTKALDWWNYYNGMYNNTTLISRSKVGTTTYAGGVRLSSTDADDPTGTFLTTGILKSLIYPTGGKTVFNYERNVYSNTSDLDNFGTTSKNAGGLRVKSIINYDPDNAATVKRFYYTNEGYADTTSTATSSGLLINPPSFIAIKTMSDAHVEILPTTLSLTIQVCYSGATFLVRTSASNSVPGFSAHGAIVGYSKVTEVSGPTGEGGIIEYFYKNIPDVLNDIPGTPNISTATNGQLIKESYKDKNLQLIRQNTYQYALGDSSSLKGVKVINFDNNGFGFCFLPRYYDNISEWWKLTSKTETNYFGADVVSTTTDYFYSNSLHKEVTQDETTQSDGSKLIRKYKRIQDYAGYTSNAVFNTMSIKHMISLPIEEQVLVQRASTSKLLSGTLTKYKQVTTTYSSTSYNHIVPDVKYALNVQSPSTDLTASSISGGVLNMHSGYEAVLQYGLYDDQGNIREYHKPLDASTSYLWGYDNKSVPVAEIKNAQPDQVFYESFEYTMGSTVSNLAKTGRKVWGSGSYSFPGSYIPIAGSKMSYWYYNGSTWIFSGVVPYSATISSSGQMLDEIRAYPTSALISTYTYDPLIGTTSETDPNNVSTYYSYDIFGRLKLVKNTDGDIVKKYDYHYKQ